MQKCWIVEKIYIEFILNEHPKFEVLSNFFHENAKYYTINI